MRVLFPNHPLKAKKADPDYQKEFEAAEEAGFGCEVYSLEELRAGDVCAALGNCSLAANENEDIVHRGWMMTDEEYRRLFEGLVAKGYRPVVNPDQYAEAHYLPNAYKHLEGYTPESKWMFGSETDEAWRLYQGLSNGDVIVKDFVKSAKHRWKDACFIPKGTNRERFEEIIRALLVARGTMFNKGLVFRRYHRVVELEKDARGIPVHEEYRMFFWKGELVGATPALRGNGPLEKLELWTTIAKRFSSPFISMDVAREESGGWIVIEVGDGGVSGMPDGIESKEFYEKLRKRIVGEA